MADPQIKIKRSAVAGKIPTSDQLLLGEIALNTYDGRLFASRNVGIGTTVFAINPWIVGVGTNTYNTYFTEGSVGIGTNNPATGIKLDVLGGEIRAGRIDTSSEGGQVSFGRSIDNATGWYLDVYGSTSTPDFRVIDVSNAAVRAVFSGSGNFGIKNATPTSALDVSGDAKVAGVVTATKFSGDGSLLTNLPGGSGSSTLGVGTAGGTVGTGITFLSFKGAALSSVTASSGIATVTVSPPSLNVTARGGTLIPINYVVGSTGNFFTVAGRSANTNITLSS